MNSSKGRGEVSLVCVSDRNNNKYYNMRDNGDGTFTASYGRVGGHETQRTYPISMWNKKLSEKKRPKSSGKASYVDVTEFVGEELSDSGPVDIDSDDPIVKSLVRKLQEYAKGAVSRTYRVSVGNVTQKMIDEAQSIVDELAGMVKEEQQSGQLNVSEANSALLSLYTIIPRQMDNVNNNLLPRSGGLSRILSREQDNIDTLAQQVTAHHRGDDREGGTGILESMGIEIAKTPADEMSMIQKMADQDSRYVKKAFSVENIRTRNRFREFLNSRPGDADNKQMLLWHGSRNQNWLSIVENGLLIRPSGVVHTGNAFGDGIYFAEELGKSRGYTSVRGAYWTDGYDNVGYCALYDVFVGKQLVLDWGDYSLNIRELERRGGYDSTYGKKGRLNRSELIVYRPSQATIKYLVEIT